MVASHYHAIHPMKRQILILGLLGGLLIALLKWSEYQFFVLDHSIEIYVTLIAAVFAALGIGVGLKLTRPPVPAVTDPVPLAAPTPFAPDPATRDHLRITRRELESSPSSPAVSPTGRSPPSSLSAKTPSRPTAAAPSTNSAPAAARRPSNSANSSASSPSKAPRLTQTDDFAQGHPKSPKA